MNQIDRIASAIFNQTHKGELDVVEFIGDTLLVNVVFDHRDDMPHISDLQADLRKLGIKRHQVSADPEGTLGVYRVQLDDISEQDQDYLINRINTLFAIE